MRPRNTETRQVVSLRLSEKEATELRDAARRAGMSLSQFIRGAALNSADHLWLAQRVREQA